MKRVWTAAEGSFLEHLCKELHRSMTSSLKGTKIFKLDTQGHVNGESDMPFTLEKEEGCDQKHSTRLRR